MVARHGLSEVHAPPEGKDTTALIVFVHGLFGHPFNTWASKPPKSRSKSPLHRPISPSSIGKSANSPRSSFETRNDDGEETRTQPGSSVFWPRDLLPNELLDVRIFTWGYDADIDGFGSASQNTIHQHAGSLLSDIADQRELSKHYKKPIIFVVHSLGGIIVKAALNKSSAIQGTRLKDIAPATFGVCFLGTPHRGSTSASLGKIAFDITKAATRRPNTRLLQGLERNSETLDQVGDTFAQTMLRSSRKLRISSFREEKETRKYLFWNTLVVDADSAKIGDGHEEVGSIPANHSRMTKFDDSGDIGFKRVTAQLRRWAQEIRGHRDVSPADIEDCMTSLTTPETKIRIANVQTAYEATFHWLFDPNVVSFRNWLCNGVKHSQPLYWIQGKPGSGKSTLMKFAMKDPRTIALLGNDSEPQWTIAAFFFHDRGSTVQKSLVGMLREIIESIFKQIPDLMPHAIALYKDLSKSQRTRFPDWNLEALTALMKTIMGQRETRIKLLLFIDALDEHEGDHDLLVHILNESISNADDNYVTLKICLASRSWPVFTDYFGHGPNFAIDHFTKDDIRFYTESRLNASLAGLSQPLGLESVWVVDLIEQITTKAQGVFIWVRLVTDQLAKNVRDGTPYQTLRAMVAGMPEELQELYDHTIRRISPEYIPETHVMFQLVLCSIERLPLASLMQATEYSLSRCRITPAAATDPSSHTSTQGLRWLKSRAGGLLETYSASIDGSSDSGAHTDYVQFLHQTAKEYIQESRAQATMELWAYSVAQKNGFYFLALASQSWLAWVAPIKIHMLYYAKMTEIDKQIDERINLPIDYTEVGNAKLPCGIKWWLGQQKGQSSELLHVVTSIVSTDYRLLSVAVAANLLFMVDSQRIYPDTVRHDIDTQRSIPCLLQIAIGGPDIVPTKLQDRAAMVVKLLAFGYPPDRRIIVPPVLTGAVEHNSKPEVQEIQQLFSEGTIEPAPLEFLLSRCGSVRLSDETRLSILNALCDAGVGLNNRLPTTTISLGIDKYDAWTSPLAFCAQNEGEDVVRFLLRRGADSSMREASGWLPIDYALMRQDKAIFAAFSEQQGEPLGADYKISVKVDDRGNLEMLGCLGSLVMPSSTFFSSYGHPRLAILMARSRARRGRWSTRRLRVLGGSEARERSIPPHELSNVEEEAGDDRLEQEKD
ncbi:MAG: hypothetical protein Q9193_001220 [Seirophora villosa]